MNKRDFAGNIVLIGSSTGGIPIIEELLMGFDTEKTAVLIAQHMPEGYTEQWAERMNRQSSFLVKEAEDGDSIENGKVLVAPGNRHLIMDPRGNYKVEVNEEPPVNLFRPSIDVLFGSALNYPAHLIVPVMLSGMCSDGVKSMMKLRERGCETIAQNEETSPVYGMNREALERGAAIYSMSPTEIIEFINNRTT